MLRLDAYVRTSRVAGREGPSFIGPEVQLDEINRWANGRAEIVRVFEDRDASGSTMRRPAFDEVLARAEAGTTDGIVVAYLSRFARSLPGALEAISRLDAAGATFVSVKEGLDPTTPAGKMMQRLLLVLAEFELDRIRESWQESRRRAVERGVHIASKTPTGYLKGEDSRLRLDPKAAPIIAEMFRQKAGGASWRELAMLLDDVPTPYGATRWTTASIAHLMKNRVYLGEARSGEFTNSDAHAPIVTPAEFAAAQRRGVRSPASSGGALLSGLLRCAGCRYVLKADTQPTRTGGKVRVYRCREHAMGECKARAAVLGSVVEPWLVEKFFRRVGRLQAREIASNDALAALKAAMDEAVLERDAYRDTPIASLGADVWAEGMEWRSREADEATDAYEAALAESSIDFPDEVELRRIWPDLTVPEQRQLLSAAIDGVVLWSVRQRNTAIEARTLILWHGQAPADLPGPGKFAKFAPWSGDPPAAGARGEDGLEGAAD